MSKNKKDEKLDTKRLLSDIHKALEKHKDNPDAFRGSNGPGGGSCGSSGGAGGGGGADGSRVVQTVLRDPEPDQA